MTLAVAALFAQGPTRIRNVYNWRVKVCPAAMASLCPPLTLLSSLHARERVQHTSVILVAAVGLNTEDYACAHECLKDSGGCL